MNDGESVTKRERQHSASAPSSVVGVHAEDSSSARPKVHRTRRRIYEEPEAQPDAAAPPLSSAGAEPDNTLRDHSSSEPAAAAVVLVKSVAFSSTNELDLRAKAEVQRTVILTMGVGVLPLPIVDVVALTALQLRMLRRLAELYSVSFSEHRGRACIAALVGSVAPVSTAGGAALSLFKTLPGVGLVLGPLFMSSFAGAATYAVGQVFIQHFAAGGTILDFEPARVEKYFREQFEHARVSRRS